MFKTDRLRLIEISSSIKTLKWKDKLLTKTLDITAMLSHVYKLLVGLVYD